MKRHLIAASIAIIGVVTITKLVERVRTDVRWAFVRHECCGNHDAGLLARLGSVSYA